LTAADTARTTRSAPRERLVRFAGTMMAIELLVFEFRARSYEEDNT
jgi:hypothetical protein